MKRIYFILVLLLLVLPTAAHAFRTTATETTATLAVEIAAQLVDAKCTAQPDDKVLVLGSPAFPDVVPDPSLETAYAIRLLSGKCVDYEATVLASALKDITSP